MKRAILLIASLTAVAAFALTFNPRPGYLELVSSDATERRPGMGGAGVYGATSLNVDTYDLRRLAALRIAGK